MRRVLADALAAGFEVVGDAADGDEALALCRALRPDALTLDLAMPGLDGLGVLRALRDGKAEPVPVVVVSAFSPAHGARAVDALAEGAFDLVAKPAPGESLETFTDELGRKVTRPRTRGRVRRPARRPRRAAPRPPPPRAAAAPPRAAPARRAVVHRLLDRRPARARRARARAAGAARRRRRDRPAHAGRASPPRWPPASTAPSPLTVREARTRRRARARHALLLAPGGSAPAPRRRPPLRARDDAPDGRPAPARRPHDRRRRAALRPPPAARRPDGHGQGRPRRRRARSSAAGGRVLVEAESTCTVYGMPRAVAEAGLADARPAARRAARRDRRGAAMSPRRARAAA